MMKMFTEYDLTETNKVQEVRWMEPDGNSSCTATLNEDGETYRYQSSLVGDTNPVEAPQDMSLADCVLSAHVHMGIIPPHNFKPIESPNQH